jgi:hypothetical protein
MTALHSTVGTLIIVGYIVVLALNVRMATGRPMLSWQRPVSFGAATLVLAQVMLGFSLLGEGRDIPPLHFIMALLAIIPIGAEHALGSKEPVPRKAGRIGAIANVVTLAIVLAAYIIGETHS